MSVLRVCAHAEMNTLIYIIEVSINHKSTLSILVNAADHGDWLPRMKRTVQWCAHWKTQINPDQCFLCQLKGCIQ